MSKMRQVTVCSRGCSKIVGSQYGTCFMSLFWRLEIPVVTRLAEIFWNFDFKTTQIKHFLTNNISVFCYVSPVTLIKADVSEELAAYI